MNHALYTGSEKSERLETKQNASGARFRLYLPQETIALQYRITLSPQDVANTSVSSVYDSLLLREKIKLGRLRSDSIGDCSLKTMVRNIGS